MAVQLKTPGVYVEEIATLPPSVAEVSTAVPAFIGYVERGDGAARIGSFLEYQALFGTAPPARFNVGVPADPNATALTLERQDEPAAATLFYAVSHYFANGGGPCWIIPIGGGANAAADFAAGLARLEQEDEPTLILFPQAAERLDLDDYGALAQAALAQCNKLKDRFVLLDVPGGDVGGFRNAVGNNNLSYAAAYHPYLATTITWHTDDASVSVERMTGGVTMFTKDFPAGGGGLTVGFAGNADAAPRVRIVMGAAADGISFKLEGKTLIIGNVDGKTGAVIFDAWQAAPDKPAGFTIGKQGAGDGTLAATAAAGTPLVAQATSTQLSELKTGQTALYNQVKEAVARVRVTLPPSAAVAGAYASVDRDRGVWRAPANVGLNATIAPVTRVTDTDQQDLNVDTTAGKSINVIRAFAGKGTLIWGARTLAGNDNEWRYVPVRRLFITVEESTRKASAFAVFEPNDPTTWLKVKGMIESYLYSLWERGALAGSKPEAAYYVNVGLGRTMTAQDVLEGRLIVEIGIAAVRPAEFVVLRFMHRLQQG
jgi:hypothetical protein